MDRTTNLPTGTVTFFFSDVEGSTGLLQRLAGSYRDVIERHAVIVRRSLAAHDGIEVSTEGDSFFAVFTSTADAVAAAGDIQQALADEAWPEGGVVAVRIGLHTGTGELGHDNYIGIDVNRAARISQAGHGGQVVVSEAVRVLSSGTTFTDLGEHTLKGLDQPEHLYQLDIAGLPQTFPPLRTASQRPNNLPTLASQIVGRHSEQQRLTDLIDANRLVTLTGPGGIGKTRLALEVANDVLGRFTNGVFLVDLTPIDDPELFLPAIATATGIHPTDNGGLAGALSDGPRLLVLDNFEQLTDAAPRLATLMAAAAPLKVLATSQVPLRIAGETIMRLAPLAVADDDSPAVALFVERARHADPSFDLDTHRDDVLRLVDVLDGVPLAIELAAARVNVLTPAEVLDRLGTVDVLTTKRSDSPERHRSITAAVEWSYDLLTPDQQELLQALSVFRGGGSLVAIEKVLGRDPLDDLGELVDRSLVETGTGIVGKRFDMLTSVQLYAASRIPDDAPFVDRHTDHFASLAIAARKPLDAAGAANWVARLDGDIDNLRATLDRLLDTGDIARGYEALGGTWRFFQLSGRLDELELWLRRFFDAGAEVAGTAAHARALTASAARHYWRGDWQKAADDYEEAVAIAEQGDDTELLADAVIGLAATRTNAYSLGIDIGDPSEAISRARQLATELDNMVMLALAEFSEVQIARASGAYPGRALLEQLDSAIEMLRPAGMLMNVGHLRSSQSEILISEGDHTAARDTALDALASAEQAGDVFTMSWALFRLATALIELGEPVRGTRIAGAADAARERSGGEFPPPFTPIEGPLERAIRIVGADAAMRLWGEGRELTLFAAVDLARETAQQT